MTTNYKILSIDESGKASYQHLSKLFVLSAVLIDEDFKSKLDAKIKKLKLKYFKNEDIVFHSRDMSRKRGPFSLLKNKQIETKFWSELISILNDPQISLIFIITDKKRARKLGWLPKTILKRSYTRVLELFLTQLTKDQSKGKIVVESDPTQDPYLIEAHTAQQTQNQSYRNCVTSLALVNKTNFDSDVQIADALAIIAGMIFSKTRPKSNIDKVKIRLIERKLRDQNNPSYLESLL